MKTIVAGSRSINNYSLVMHNLLHIEHDGFEITEIVSGRARGVDKLGESFAKERKKPVKEFLADWKMHGKAAGYIRNKKMAKYADALVAFWDGDSKGTKHMINLAREEGLKVWIFIVSEDGVERMVTETREG